MNESERMVRYQYVTVPAVECSGGNAMTESERMVWAAAFAAAKAGHKTTDEAVARAASAVHAFRAAAVESKDPLLQEMAEDNRELRYRTTRTAA